jgi:large conductance mechanosensitive channel
MSVKEKSGGIIAEFRKFVARGNVMDLAVGVIIGGAFQGIVNSLVNDIINPILGIFAGDSEALGALAIQLPGGGQLMVGSFINAVINFFLMAVVIFLLVKILNTFHRKKQEQPPAPPASSQEVVLLTEIRDLLKEQPDV